MTGLGGHAQHSINHHDRPTAGKRVESSLAVTSPCFLVRHSPPPPPPPSRRAKLPKEPQIVDFSRSAPLLYVFRGMQPSAAKEIVSVRTDWTAQGRRSRRLANSTRGKIAIGDDVMLSVSANKLTVPCTLCPTRRRLRGRQRRLLLPVAGGRDGGQQDQETDKGQAAKRTGGTRCRRPDLCPVVRRQPALSPQHAQRPRISQRTLGPEYSPQAIPPP